MGCKRGIRGNSRALFPLFIQPQSLRFQSERRRIIGRKRILFRELEEKKGTKKRKEGRKESMVSREQKRAVLHEKLQLLRSITNSHAVIPLCAYSDSFASIGFLLMSPMMPPPIFLCNMMYI